MGGVKTVDRRAHGTRKRMTSSHQTWLKHKHMVSKLNHKPCGQTEWDTDTAKETLISRVFTQNMTTWKHAAGVFHCYTEHVNSKQPLAHTTRQQMLIPCAHNRRQTQGALCPNPDTQTKLDRSAGIQTQRPTHETRHTDKRAQASSTLETARSDKDKTIQECQDSAIKPRNKLKWQNPDITLRSQNFKLY